MNFETMTDEEKDLRVDLITALLNCPHGEYAPMFQKHEAIFKADPMFYAHAAAWHAKEGKIRDHNVLFVAGLLMQHDELFYKSGKRLLSRLAPYQVKGMNIFVRNEMGVNAKRYRRAVKRYVQELLADPQRLEGSVMKMRSAVKALVQSSRVALTDEQQAIIFGLTKAQKASGFKVSERLDSIQRLAKATTDTERASLIRHYRIPFTTAVGALDEMTPATLLALIEVATPQEVLNLASRLESYNAYGNAEVKALVETKIKAASKDSRVNMAKLSRAFDKVKDESVKKEVARAQQKIIANNSIKGDVAVFGDVSGSMSAVVDVMAQVMSFICSATMKEPKGFFFNTSAMAVDIPKDKTYQGFVKAFRYTVATGGTALGVGFKSLKNAVDTVIIVTDEDNTAYPTFGDGLDYYKNQFGDYPSVVVLRVDAGSDKDVQTDCKKRGVECTAFRYTGDYNELNNLLPLLKSGSRHALIEKIYSTPLA